MLTINERFARVIKSLGMTTHEAEMTLSQFIDRAVMLEIRMMLRSTDLSVQEIAYRLKFPDQSYLGRFFKKHAGESPTEDRSRLRSPL